MNCSILVFNICLLAKVSMEKDKESGVYKIVEVVGVSTVSWEDAAKRAVETAAKSLRDLRIAEVTKMDVKVEDGKAALLIPPCIGMRRDRQGAMPALIRWTVPVPTQNR